MSHIGISVGRSPSILLQELPSRSGLRFQRWFTRMLQPGKTPYDEVSWEKRTTSIHNHKGEVVFEQRDVEVPSSWSQSAANIVASKYFRGRISSHAREGSVAQLVRRVVDTISHWGVESGYFRAMEDTESFRAELAHLILTQKACFNSPVWFNVGVTGSSGYGFCVDEDAKEVRKVLDREHRPQCSACFIISVEDSMESILELVKTEGMLFKWGSGTGTNLSTLREEGAFLSGSGQSSGPLSFMKGYDVFAGVIKSGGNTRRAAKMVILDAEHPDIEQFVLSKPREEKKARVLIDAGYDGSIDGEAYSSVFFQNANLTVRVTDEFMQAVLEDKEWWSKSVTTGQPVKRHHARQLLRQIAEGAHQCGDPGMQFDSVINRWHTCKRSGRIRGSNPCSEYMFLDDSACNLASINLLKFLDGESNFDVEGFRRAVDTMILAQEILVAHSAYPTAKIARNSHDFRPLGLGYCNLGSLLMSLGIPYDSDHGRDYAAAITALMSGEAYLMSARLAEAMGSFAAYKQNEDCFLEVIRMHWSAARSLASRTAPKQIQDAAAESWRQAYEKGEQFGFRNAQTTVIAPTGTIGFMMDCDTTGIEPELALVKQKRLVGGGVMKVVNNTVPRALRQLGYSPSEVEKIILHVEHTGTIEGAPDVRPEHLPVFDCSFRSQNGSRSIHHLGHIRMMADVQPFLSGAISKTINMPADSTVEQIMDTYIESWKLGLKAVAIYRDGSKHIQPLSAVGKDRNGDAPPESSVITSPKHSPLARRKMPDERQSITHNFSVAGHEGYVTVGLYEDGTPGEIFILMSKAGSTISGLMHVLSTSISFGLQYGVPLEFFAEKFSHVRFEPSGFTGNQDLPFATSIIDYIFRWLAKRFIGAEQDEFGQNAKAPIPQLGLPPTRLWKPSITTDAPLCVHCGNLMSPAGSCYKCENCGSTSACS